MSKEQEEDYNKMRDKLEETQRKRAAIQSQNQVTTIFKRKCELTLKECNELDAKAVTYKSVGRMFIKTPVDDLKEELKSKIEKSGTGLETLKKQEDYLTKDIDTQLKQIEEFRSELIRQAQAQETAKA